MVKKLFLFLMVLPFLLNACSGQPGDVSQALEEDCVGPSCETPPSCGDGICATTGQLQENAENCPADCFCGDGTKDPTEECDLIEPEDSSSQLGCSILANPPQVCIPAGQPEECTCQSEAPPTCGNGNHDKNTEACDPSAFNTGCEPPALCNSDCSACITPICCDEGFIHCPNDPTADCVRPCNHNGECPGNIDEGTQICGPDSSQSPSDCPSGTFLCPNRHNPAELICAIPCNIDDECVDLPGGRAADEAFILCGHCPETECTDGLDNDGDGRTDCGDREDCSQDPGCRCGNGTIEFSEQCDPGDNRSCLVEEYCLPDCTDCESKSCRSSGTIHCLSFSTGDFVIPCDGNYECADGFDEGLLNLGFICSANGQPCPAGEISCSIMGSNQCVIPCDGAVDCDDPEMDGISVDENPSLCGTCFP